MRAVKALQPAVATLLTIWSASVLKVSVSCAL